MKRYEITGRTSVFFNDRAVGDIIEDDLDDITEQQLIDVGAIRPLPEERKEPAKKPAASKSSSTRK